jgi:hypothetical protein
MPNPVTYVRVSGKTAGSDLVTKLIVIGNVALSNAFRNIGLWFEAIGLGARTFNGFVHAGGTPASDTVTFTAFANTNTITVNGVVFTGTTAAPVSNVTFQIGASDTATALNFLRLINGLGPAAFGPPPAKVWGVVQATNVANVVTLTSTEPGAIGNLMTLAISAGGSVGGALFTSGADGTITALAKGI